VLKLGGAGRLTTDGAPVVDWAMHSRSTLIEDGGGPPKPFGEQWWCGWAASPGPQEEKKKDKDFSPRGTEGRSTAKEERRLKPALHLACWRLPARTPGG